MSVTMSREDRERFLAGVHVGVLSVASADGAGPLAVPVWYAYVSANPTGGQIVFRMSAEHWLTVDQSKVHG
jgi:nitroimidazol reductase NimA-like FMN-containing flavoprotein (pyridoxamine 5'-phosphate oxidase superfamily)